MEHRQSEVAAASPFRRRGGEAAREVTLDPERLDSHLVTFSDLDPGAAEEYNKLAIGLISAAIKRPPSSERPFKRILILSAQHGDGRTCVTLNLACALARANLRVLIIDTDLLRPGTLRLLGLDSEIGLAETLDRRVPGEAAVIHIQPHNICLLPTRARVDKSAELLTSPAFRTMLQGVEADYDFILFDSPPLLARGDSSLLLHLTDAALLVIRPGKTSSTQMRKAISPLSQDDLFGVVLNRTAP